MLETVTVRALRLLSASLASLLFLLPGCGDSPQETDTKDGEFIFPKKDNIQQQDYGSDLGTEDLDVVEDGETVTDVVEDTQYEEEFTFPDLEDSVDQYTPPDVVEVTDIPKDETTQPPEELLFDTFGPMTISPMGILVNGQYTQFRFAQLSYWKYPESSWNDLLDRIKWAGFNGVAVSACWRMHEPVQGQYDFVSPNLDIVDFLDRIVERGLYIYFDAGPWIDGEPAGCLPEWVVANGNETPASFPDGKLAIRTNDQDYLLAVGAYLDQLNPKLISYQLSINPQGKLVFYQFESRYDLFYFLKDAQNWIRKELMGMPLVPINPALYLAQMRDMITQDGLNLPLIASITGDFENGGKMVSVLGSVPDVHPALDLDTRSPYIPMESKFWAFRKELRNKALHGQTYLASPAIAVGLLPSPAHLSRVLLAGADVVVVKGFAAALLPPDMGRVSLDQSGVDIFAELDKAKVAIGSFIEDWPSPIALSGLPRKMAYGFKMVNQVFERFGPGIAGRDMPHRTGPNDSKNPFKLEITGKSVGAIEDKWVIPAPGQAGGILELFGDNFKRWYLTPSEPTGRATYFMDSSDGTILVSLVALDAIKDGVNAHEPEDSLTKIKLNGVELPRHSSIIVPRSTDFGEGENYLGWGHKTVILNHPLGLGYPMLEYCTANLAALRKFNDRLLILTHGKPSVKANGVWLTEPGEVSLSNFTGVPGIYYNGLVEGGLFTDPGGKIAVQLQHAQTSHMVISAALGKLIHIMATRTELGRTAWFTTLEDGSDFGVLGLEHVDSVTATDGVVSIKGSAAVDATELILLVWNKPNKVKLGGKNLDCTWQEKAKAMACSLTSVKPSALTHSGLFQRPDSFNGFLADLGFNEHPEAFTEIVGDPVPSDNPSVGINWGLGWYYTEFEAMEPVPTQQGSIVFGGAADIVGLFINGTYIGSATPLGNTPMTALDVATGMPSTIGFRVPGGLIQQGINSVAVRTLTIGRSQDSIPMFYGSAPILPPELDIYAASIPHLAIDGLNVSSHKGLWGSAKITAGAMVKPLNTAWTATMGDPDTGMGLTPAIMAGYHNLPPATESATNAGFSPVGVLNADTPLLIQDGQISWVTASFMSSQLGHKGGIDLVLKGKSLVGLVFLNGTPVGSWVSDEAALAQGLHSKLVQGAGTRQILPDLNWHIKGLGSPDRIKLPEHLLKFGAGVDNRVVVMLVDISPPSEENTVVNGIGSITGTGQLTNFVLEWNLDEPLPGKGTPNGSPLLWFDVDITLEPPPV